MRLICLLAAASFVSGCTSFGPDIVRGSRTDYNIALRATEDEQLLLNLVRLRYRDRVLFLEASALTTQFTIGRDANISATITDPENSVGIRGGVVFEENPTVTYTPLQGQDFVQRVLAPIPLETLLLLDSSGWSSERVLRVCVQRMNALRNAPLADGPTPDQVPEYEEFLRATKILRRLELADLVEGATDAESGMPMLRFSPTARGNTDFQALMTLLQLDPERLVYPLTTTLSTPAADVLNLRTRSFVGMMYYLSQAVEVPPADTDAGRVTVTRDPSGQPFDWNRVTAELMHIRSSAEPPQNAAVAVQYRGSWFYIDDSDLNSKSTLSLLGQIFALQAGDVESAAPLLTLPVGGG